MLPPSIHATQVVRALRACAVTVSALARESGLTLQEVTVTLITLMDKGMIGIRAKDERDSTTGRLQALVKSEMSGVVYDASRKRPLYSKSVDEAVAKRDAITRAFAEFLTMVEGIKKKV